METREIKAGDSDSQRRGARNDNTHRTDSDRNQGHRNLRRRRHPHAWRSRRAGFGILTEIDMQATLKAKLDEDMEKYLIMGACNPPLAHRAVSVDRQIGLLLPCNVVVREDTTTENSFFVEAMNPALMVQVSGEPGLESVAADAAVKLRAAVDSLI